MKIKISNQARTYLARVLKLTSQWALHNANSKGTTPRKSAQLLQEQERNTQSADSMLFRSFWTHQRSTEKMRPNLIAMKIKISNQARTYLARVLKLTSQWALHNANSKGTTPRKSAQLLQEQERNTQSADSMLFRSFWTHQRSTEKMRPNLIAMKIKISNQARTYLARVLKLTSQWALHNANSKGTTPRKSAQLLQEQERNTQSADSMLFRSFWTHQRSTEKMRPLACDLDGNECLLQTHNCSSSASCTDTVGSYNCTCYSGFSGDGKSCNGMLQLVSIRGTQAPPSVRELHVFLEFAGFYRRFIPGFAQHSAPLNVLAGMGASFLWTKSSDAASTPVKRSLTTAPVHSVSWLFCLVWQPCSRY